MCGDNTEVPGGGLVLASPRFDQDQLGAPGPLRDGEDVSWLPHALPGDDQGEDGACAIFALASWSEIMHRTRISDRVCIHVYHRALRRLGKRAGGLTFSEAFRAAMEAGWLPGATGMSRVRDLGVLREQPLLAGYSITPAWRAASRISGCLDHSESAAKPFMGHHAVVIVARGNLSRLPEAGPWIYVENSWGSNWGWRGIGVMSQALHQSMITELWRVA